jgi:hypothetical protein
MSEIRIAKSRRDLKMLRNDEYLRRIRLMLAAMKNERAYVPPAWLGPRDIEALVAKLGGSGIKILR